MAKLDKEKLICEEIEKLNNIFEDIQDNSKELVEGLIQNAAFMRVTMAELQEDITEYGAMLEVTSGNGFQTIKDNPSFKAYTTMISRYSVVIQQLQKLLPSDEVQADEFLDFINQ